MSTTENHKRLEIIPLGLFSAKYTELTNGWPDHINKLTIPPVYKKLTEYERRLIKRERRIKHRIRLKQCGIVRGARGKERRRLLRKLLERDGNLCHWCKQPVTEGFDKLSLSPNKTIKFIRGDKQAWLKRASIEHIVPTSKGGTNKLENLKLVHTGCNK